MSARPEFVSEAHLEFLDRVRESGHINMYGAAPVVREFDPSLSRRDSHEVLKYWMLTFEERHPIEYWMGDDEDA